jgi:hypothetical protein
LIFASGMVYQYTQKWSFAEREYLGNYMRASTLGRLWDENYYWLLVCIDKKDHPFVSGDAIESVRVVDGKLIYSLTEAGVKAGVASVTTVHDKFHNAWVRETLEHEVYQDQTVWDYVKWPVYGSLCFLPMLLFFAVPKDRKRELEFQYGRRLRGPERVTTAEFNRKMGRRKGLLRRPADGLALTNTNRSWTDRTFPTP